MDVVLQTCNPSTQEVGVEELAQVQGQPDLHSDFYMSQNSIAKPCLKKQTKTMNRKAKLF